MHPAPERRYVSMADAAKYAACNERTIRDHIATGEITGYKLGRVYRIDLNELDAWLARDTAPKQCGSQQPSLFAECGESE